MISAIEFIIGVFMVTYFPITTYTLYSIISLRFVRHTYRYHNTRPPNRRIVVLICTNGQNTDVVEDIISKLHTYGVRFDIMVLKEAYDRFQYSADTITVPTHYNTPNDSHRKMRALQYSIEYMHDILGYGEETYIVHLDDDSIIPEHYLHYVELMMSPAGQGSIRLRDYGHNLMSTMADMVRVSDCDIYCRNFNTKSKPKLVHGEGLVIRADAEYDIGWDYGGYGAEDLIMGISLAHHGYTFEYIPSYIYISPPVTTSDFYKQRRRWTYSILNNHNHIMNNSRGSMAFILYRYAVGWLGMIGITMWFIDVAFGIKLPFVYTIGGVYNLLMSLIIYEYGVYHTHRRYMPLMALLIIPIAFYEGGTFVYTLLKPPMKNTFDVIRKVRISNSDNMQK